MPHRLARLHDVPALSPESTGRLSPSVTSATEDLLTCCACLFARHEQGEYFSLDLGGSNLRVMFVKLSREHGQVVGTSCVDPWHPVTSQHGAACQQRFAGQISNRYLYVLGMFAATLIDVPGLN